MNLLSAIIAIFSTRKARKMHLCTSVHCGVILLAAFLVKKKKSTSSLKCIEKAARMHQ